MNGQYIEVSTQPAKLATEEMSEVARLSKYEVVWGCRRAACGCVLAEPRVNVLAEPRVNVLAEPRVNVLAEPRVSVLAEPRVKVLEE